MADTSGLMSAATMAVPGLGWVQAAGTILSALKTSESSSAGAQSYTADGQLNTSGWVVGEGDATGGTISAFGLAWYVWAGLGVVALYAIKKGKI